MYSMMSGRQVYAPVVRTAAPFPKYSSQGMECAHGIGHVRPFDGQLCQEYLYQKSLKSVNPFQSYSR